MVETIVFPIELAINWSVFQNDKFGGCDYEKTPAALSSCVRWYLIMPSVSLLWKQKSRQKQQILSAKTGRPEPYRTHIPAAHDWQHVPCWQLSPSGGAPP